MEKIKISTLPNDTMIFVEDANYVISVEEVLKDMKDYKEKELYTVTPHHACFDAGSIMESVIEELFENK